MNNEEVEEYLEKHPWTYDIIFDEIVYGNTSTTTLTDEFQFSGSKGIITFAGFSELRKLIKTNMLFKTKKEALAFRKYVKEYKYLRGTKK